MKAEENSDARAQSVKGDGSACSVLKVAYNDCFNRWYTDKFLKGQWEKEECTVEWEAYRACLAKRLEDRNLSHLLRMETSLNASNRNN